MGIALKFLNWRWEKTNLKRYYEAGPIQRNFLPLIENGHCFKVFKLKVGTDQFLSKLILLSLTPCTNVFGTSKIVWECSDHGTLSCRQLLTLFVSMSSILIGPLPGDVPQSCSQSPRAFWSAPRHEVLK